MRADLDKARLITAEAIAHAFGLNPKSYRAALRRESFDWHGRYDPWLVSPGSPEQQQLLRVAEQMRR